MDDKTLETWRRITDYEQSGKHRKDKTTLSKMLAKEAQEKLEQKAAEARAREARNKKAKAPIEVSLWEDAGGGRLRMKSAKKLEAEYAAAVAERTACQEERAMELGEAVAGVAGTTLGVLKPKPKRRSSGFSFGLSAGPVRWSKRL